MDRVGDYITERQTINEKMRSTLVNWMLQVSLEFGHRRETCVLAVACLDLVLNCAHLSREELQLVGAVCIFIAGYALVCLLHGMDRRTLD
jgi:hypothetical protein